MTREQLLSMLEAAVRELAQHRGVPVSVVALSIGAPPGLLEGDDRAVLADGD